MTYLKFLRKRLIISEIVVTILSLVFLINLLNIQVLSIENTRSLNFIPLTISPQRGRIFDRNGVLMATSVDSYSILIQPSLLDITPELLSLLSKVGSMSEKSLKENINSGKPFYLIRRQDKVPDKLKNVPGVVISKEPKRNYPYGKTASHVLGFVNVEGYGKQGVEGYYDKFIRGKEGVSYISIDAAGRGIPSPYQGAGYPSDGSDVYLTLDLQAQRIVENYLEKGIAKHKAIGGMAILLEVNTGEIWAMASFPNFDPNRYNFATDEERRNNAISFNFEPGSVLKTLTLAIALEEGLVDLDTKFSAPSSMKFKGGLVNNYQGKAYGTQTLTEALKTSTNTVYSQLALKVGSELFKKYYYDIFGVSRFVDLDMGGKEVGLFNKPRSEIEIANIGFGQGISLTPIQLISFYSTFANGGYLCSPIIVKKIEETDENISILNKSRVIKTVFSKTTCEKVLKALEGTISKTTNISSYMEGYSFGGKTGTAQKVISGVYSKDKTINTFVGFITLKNPRFVLLVTLDEAVGTASSTAVPIFGEIAKALVDYLRIPKD